MWDGLGAIPPEFRATLVLYDIEGLTYEEIAAIENAPLGTVKSRLSRGREHLRRVLGPAMPADRAREIEATGNTAAADLVRPERTEPA